MVSTYTVHFDTETGGIETQHPTIQLAAVAVDQNGDECGAFQQRIAFDVAACDPEALTMNHYDAALWADAVTPAVTAAKFAAWLRPFSSVQLVSKRTGRPYAVAQLAGYNALTFDMPRLREMFGASFFPCSYRVRDIMQRVLFYFDESGETPPENFKLSTVAQYFGIDTAGAHDALMDARLSAAVYRCVREAL